MNWISSWRKRFIFWRLKCSTKLNYLHRSYIRHIVNWEEANVTKQLTACKFNQKSVSVFFLLHNHELWHNNNNLLFTPLCFHQIYTFVRPLIHLKWNRSWIGIAKQSKIFLFVLHCNHGYIDLCIAIPSPVQRVQFYSFSFNIVINTSNGINQM